MLNKNKSTGQGGFSLLEILIAFSIMALSLGILLRIFSGGVNTATIAEEYTTAVQIAESLMAQTGSEIPLRSEHISGVKDEKYNWQLDIRPYKLSAETMDAKAVGVELYKINVTVDWGDEGSDGDNRKIQLATLKTLSQSNNGQP
jgi:general secretion pathway protein I